MVELFEMGDNYMVELNKKWISTVPELRRLLARDKGGAGDGSGKYKKQAQREFTYIFHMYDFRSPLENYKPKDREVEALKMSELTKGKVQSDGDLWEAIKRYQELLNNCSKSLQTYRILKDSTDDLVEYIKSMDLTERTETGGKVHSPKEKQDAINGMLKTMETLVKLEEMVRQELSGDSGLRGDAEKGYDEDPE